MMGEGMEIVYRLGVHEQRRVHATLVETAQKRQTPLLPNLSHPLWLVGTTAFIAVMLLDWLARFLPRLVAGKIDFTSGSELFGLLLALIFLAIFVQGIGGIVSDLRSRLQAKAIWREGLDWGDHRLIAAPEGLTLRLSKYRAFYRWPAISEIRRTKDMLLLMITPYLAIPVPRRAFASASEEEDFTAFAEHQMLIG